MTICVLSAEIRNQIAAGEVVERPSSVVKEGIENALDAGAQSVEVYLVNGGKNLIKIVDDGSGMPPEDLPLAVLRHATSKLHRIEDLFHLQQYGFRGEALAAVSAVSDFTLISRTTTSTEAFKLKGKAGQFEKIKIIAANPGTTLVVENLFAPLPARLEYLKSDNAEYQACVKELYGFALANPNVSFQLYNQEKLSLDYPATQLENRVKQVLKNHANTLCAVDFQLPHLSIKGFTSLPGNGLSHKNQQHILVNGRRIEDHRLAYAVREAYVQSAGIEKHLFPAFVLHLTIDPILVDVNVHPRKVEVKFAEPSEVFSSVKKTVITALETVSFSPRFSSLQISAKENFGASRYLGKPTPSSSRQISAGNIFNQRLSQNTLPSFAQRHQQFQTKPSTEEHTLNSNDSSTALTLIGQADNKYIVAQTQAGLYFFDQHALHERQRFETFWQAHLQAGLVKQPLLVPDKIQIPENEVSLLHDNRTVLEQIGFEIDFLADDQVVIHAVPDLLVGQDLKSLLEKCIVYFENESLGENVCNQIMRKLLEYKACRGAVMFGDALERAEMEKLIQDFDKTDWKLLCPHGRPNHHFMPFAELDKKFHR